jgi:3-methyladenine DNA glycosylase AlkD
MARVAIDVSHALGISMPNVRAIAKWAGIDQRLATDLWDTGIHEARILATLVADPAALTAERMDAWAADLTSWDLCDAAADVFGRTSIAKRTIRAWASSPEGFVKRCAFSMIARRAVWAKNAPDREFLGYLPLIRRGATDPRNEVKKGVSWALRQIGKRNAALQGAAIAEAERLVEIDAAPARWIGRDALRELRSTEVLRRRSRKAPIRTPRA